MRIEVQEWDRQEPRPGTAAPDHDSARRMASHRGWIPKVDLFESESHILVRVDLAGVSRKQVQVAFSPERRTLTIRGIRLDDLGSRGEKYRPLILEIEEGEFIREVALPDVDLLIALAEASLSDGILTLTLPKGRAPKARIIIEETITIRSLI